jgi:hypothetical protein
MEIWYSDMDSCLVDYRKKEMWSFFTEGTAKVFN